MRAVGKRSVTGAVFPRAAVDTVVDRRQYHDRYDKNSDKNRKSDNEARDTAHAGCVHD